VYLFLVNEGEILELTIVLKMWHVRA